MVMATMANDVIPVIGAVEARALPNVQWLTLSRVALNIQIRVSDILEDSDKLPDIVTLEALLDKEAYQGLLLELRKSALELFWNPPS